MNSFTALADPTRRGIVQMLAARGRLSASDISGRFPVSAPAISQHLKVLREARLVRVEKQAQKRIYAIDPYGLDEVADWVSDLRRLWNERFDALDEVLKAEMKKAKSNRRK